jgi:hypothetical protein
MLKSLIMKSQANEVFDLIRSASFDPANFRWLEVSSGQTAGLTISELRHDIGHFFQFDYRGHKHFCSFSPGSETPQELQYPGNWPLTLTYVANWLAFLKREQEAPDLWETLRQETRLLEAAAASDDDNRPFTQPERDRITAGLREISEHLSSTEALDEARQGFIEARLKYLEQAASRLGRKDWINMTVGVLGNIAVGALFSTSSARELFRIAGVVLRWLLSGQPSLN